MRRGELMGLFDKIKNALFEVEYVEVDEPPKKDKKVQEENEDKPIAKKVILPGRREDRVEELEEEELKDQDFEIRPKEETLKVKTREEFKVMNDNDFKMDEDIDIEEPQIIQVLDMNNTPVVEEKKEEEAVIPTPAVEREEVYTNVVEVSTPSHEAKLYGVDRSYDVPVHPYGTYEKREEKTYFRPSPIISPIYGILDKNYKKEDVREKKEIHITSYTKENATVDDVRNKAYGNKQSVEVESLDTEVEDTSKFDVEEEKEDNVLVDLSDRAKPEVKEITMGDAVEYFQDLGLEYNVDYMDVSKGKQVPKKEEVKVPEKKEKEMALTKDLEDTMELGATNEKVESKEKKVDNVGDDTNDNLFDLIDSMYQEND